VGDDSLTGPKVGIGHGTCNMIRSIYVPLSEEVRQALWLLADAEHRSAKDQAALIITEALTRSGFLELVRPAERPAEKPTR